MSDVAAPSTPSTATPANLREIGGTGFQAGRQRTVIRHVERHYGGVREYLLSIGLSPAEVDAL